MLTVGEDTYTTVSEADAFAASRYALTSAGAYWGALSVDEKEGFLREALLHIDSLPVRGGKQQPYQRLNFPRYAMGRYPESNWQDIPLEVKQAQTSEAVGIMLTRLGRPPGGKRLTSPDAEMLMRKWAPTSLKGVL